jgi:hypothetical protein
MDLDYIKRVIQDFFQENTVTIVGSGLSLAEGIPGMYDLSLELKSQIPHLLTNSVDKEIWRKICSDLSSGIGLEQALHNTKPSPQIEECVRKITANYIGQAELNVIRDILQNGKTLRFAKYIQHFNIRNHGLTVITTNYDRLIEYACECSNVRIDTLFIGKFLAHFEPEQSRYMFCSNIVKRAGKSTAIFAPKITVLKPHGCLSWHMINGEPYSIANYSQDDCLIITPGLNKYKEGYSVPFDTHRTKANSAIDCAQRYIIIGYGFGDDHLETHLVQQLYNGKPALILTHSLSANAEHLIKTCKHITAICCNNSTDSRVITATEDIILKNYKLWDIHEMLKEVF